MDVQFLALLAIDSIFFMWAAICIRKTIGSMVRSPEKLTGPAWIIANPPGSEARERLMKGSQVMTNCAAWHCMSTCLLGQAPEQKLHLVQTLQTGGR